MKDPKDCLHEKFFVKADVNRMSSVEGGPITSYSADIKINCDECGLVFDFVGVPNGISFHRPMVSADFTELRCPITPTKNEIAFKNRIEMPTEETDQEKTN